MEFFRSDTNVDFLGIRKWTALASILMFVLSIGVLITQGLNWGLDFTGGTQVAVSYPQQADFPQMRRQLAAAGFADAVVQAYGDAKSALVRIGTAEADKAAQADGQAAQSESVTTATASESERATHQARLGASAEPQSGPAATGRAAQRSLSDQVMAALPGAKLLSVEYIGPQVGQELATGGALAILIALLATMAYIALRFEWRFAISSAIALIHDPILILGVFAWVHEPFDLIALAAILTVIGYSLNDTVVVFDRVRENFRRLRKADATEVVNLAVNQTLSRTIMTSFLTLLAVLSLFLFGGDKVHGFSLALIIGIVVGTYSSIYVAGALAVAMGLNRADLLPAPKQAIDDRP